MKKVIAILLMMFYPFVSLAASEQSIRKRAFNAPDAISEDARKLAKYLVKPYDDDLDKMRVIAYWIASHIAYDSYKFDAGKVNTKNLSYKYDILKAKTGICSDFAKLFYDMSLAAGIKNVSVVTGYVVSTDRLRPNYPDKKKGTGHAWNEIIYNKRRYYVDTTYMSTDSIGRDGKKYKSALKHRLDLRRRGRKAKVSPNIRTFYFAFDTKDEVKAYKEHHWKER